MPAPRKKPQTKKKVKEVKDLTAIDYHAIQLHEYFQALKRAGFDHGTAITIVCDNQSHPTWFKVPKLSDFREWDDLEEDGDDY